MQGMLSAAELEAHAPTILRDGPRTAAEFAVVLGTSRDLAHAVLGLLAVRGAVVTCGTVQGEIDVLRRRSMHAVCAVLPRSSGQDAFLVDGAHFVQGADVV